MNLYEIVYDFQRNEGDEWLFGRVQQITADKTLNALVKFGQYKCNAYKINIVSIVKVLSR